MAQYTAYANYVIYFRDQTEYTNAVALVGGNQYQHSPAAAAALFGLAYPPAGGALGDRGMYTVSYSLSDPGSEIGHPNPSGIFLGGSVDSVVVPAQFGGADLLLIWEGIIQRVGGGGGAAPAPPTNISQRRWIAGFEFGGSAELTSLVNLSRDASRVVDGLGLAVRRNTAGFTRAVNTFSAGFTTRTSWERFYFRLREAYPGTTTQIWRTTGSPSGNSGVRLSFTSTGAILITNVDAAGTPTTLTTLAVQPLDTWVRVDLLIQYSSVTAPTAVNASFSIYLNGVLEYTNSAFPRSGLGDDTSFHVSSTLGTVAANTLACDFDDWMNADKPAALDGIDWLTGSHIETVFLTGFGAAHDVNWVGDYRNLNQLRNPLTSSSNQARLTSSTSGAILDAITDAIETQQSQGAQIGAVAALVGLYSSRASVDGTLGYTLAGGAAALTAITQQTTLDWNRIMYRPSGVALPPALVPFDLRHVKGASAGASSVVALMAEIEYLGTWGVEDDDNALPRTFITHNAPYPRSMYSATGPPPTAPVLGVQGVYVGNDTGQDINLAQPAHLVWIRPLTGASGGVKWFSSDLQSGHTGVTDRAGPSDYLVRAWIDSTGQAKFSVTGSNAQVNASGVSYQYIAFCDPGMRYCLNGAFAHAAAVATIDNPLINAAFTPQASFFHGEVLDSISNVTGLRYKGIGHTGTNGSPLNGAETANVASFAAGVITSLTNLHQASSDAQTAYSAWRTVDGSGVVMVQICSYTGNGAGSQAVTLTPTSGRTPMFVIVVPHNAQSFMRDPSHTGSDSSNVGLSTTSTTAITAVAVDQITVGSTLNTNGIVYDVFTLFEGYGPNIVAPTDPDDEPWPFPPSTPVPPDSSGACLVTFSNGTDSGGGAGCGVSL
jgi:hypothetical protein